MVGVVVVVMAEGGGGGIGIVVVVVVVTLLIAKTVQHIQTIKFTLIGDKWRTQEEYTQKEPACMQSCQNTM